MRSKYRILKLRSGEEIIASIVGQKKQKFIVERPFTLQNSQYIDQLGNPRDVVRLRSWLKFSNQNTVSIPKDHVATFLDPDDHISKLYDVEKEREDVQLPPNIVMKKDVKSQPPIDLNPDEIDPEMVEQIMKEIVEEMKNAHSEKFENENIDDVDELTGVPKNNKKEFIVMNMVFPPSLLAELINKGVVDPELFDDLMDDDDDDDDVTEPSNGEGFTEEKTDGDGTEWTDWSFDVKDYLEEDDN